MKDFIFALLIKSYTSIFTNTKALMVVLLISIIGITKISHKTSVHKKGSAAKNGLPLPPGPAQWPLIGNIPQMLQNKPTFRWIHQLMRDMNTDICLIRVGNTNVIPVVCPIIACEMLRTQDAIFADRPLTMVSNLLSGGYKATILTPYGEQWKKMRKVFSSEITSSLRFKWLHDKRSEAADNLVFFIRNMHKNNKNVDLRLVTQHYCMNVTKKMMFNVMSFGKGRINGGPGAEDIEHVDAVMKLFKYIFSFRLYDYFPLLMGLDLDGQEKIVKEIVGVLKKYQNPIVDARIRQWENGERKEMEDLLDVLITFKGTNSTMPLLTPHEIKCQISEIMVASVDNPSNAVEWAMAEMLNQPELLRKATEEIDRVVGKDRLVQESDLVNLNYVKACAREAYRLHPMSPFNVPHVAMQDTTVNGYFIPKGSHVLLSRYGLGRNPKVWESPLIYNPERHLRNDGDVVLTEHDLRFISFSTGRCGCVAPVLGSCMTTMLLARLLQCFTWSLPAEVIGVDLSEAEEHLVLGTPLIAFAKPRLAPHLYPTSHAE